MTHFLRPDMRVSDEREKSERKIRLVNFFTNRPAKKTNRGKTPTQG